MILSLELRWLGHHYKTARVLPAIGKTTRPYCGAFYVHPTDDRQDWDYYEADLRRGVIFVKDSEENDTEMANTLAHEFAHHLQFLAGMRSDTLGTEPFHEDSGLSYPDAIRKFYTESRTEAGALLFSHRMAPTSGTKYWLSLLERSSMRKTDKPFSQREKNIQACLASCRTKRASIDFGRRT